MSDVQCTYTVEQCIHDVVQYIRVWVRRTMYIQRTLIYGVHNIRRTLTYGVHNVRRTLFMTYIIYCVHNIRRTLQHILLIFSPRVHAIQTHLGENS